MRAPALLVLLTATGCGVLPGNDDQASVDQARPGDGSVAVSPHFTSLYGDYLGTCSGCHAPDAPGRTSDIETTLDFSTRGTAYTTLTTGTAAGLTGPPSACNGVRFIDKGMPGASLALAVLDEGVRMSFDLPDFPSCDRLTITDHTVKIATPPTAVFLASFRDWIQSGAVDD